jgi:hypothetical protein
MTYDHLSAQGERTLALLSNPPDEDMIVMPHDEPVWDYVDEEPEPDYSYDEEPF